MKTFTSEILSKYFALKVPSDGLVSQPFGANGFVPDVLPNGQPNTQGISLYKYYGWDGHLGIDYNGDKKNYFVPFDGWLHKFKNYGGDKSMPWSVSFVSHQETEIEGQKVRLKVNFVHIESCNFTEGQWVTADQQAGTTNNTGYPNYSSAPHLHYEVEPQYWNGLTWVNATNGYAGMVDPQPFFKDWVFDIDKFPEGTLVKAIESPRVYLIDGRKKRWFPNQAAFWLSGRSFGGNDIWKLPSFEIEKIPTGENMPDVQPKAKEEINRLYPNLLK